MLIALCRLIENTAGGCYCSVVLSDANGTPLEYGAAPSLPDTFINSIIGRPISLESGPCGMAAYLNQPVVLDDLTCEKRWTTWCPMAMQHGLRSCWSTPITSASGKVLGAFAIYHESPTAPTLLLQGLIEQFTHAVARVQGDAALRRSETLLSEAQHLSSTGSFSWRVTSDVVEYSEQTYRTYEFEPRLPVTLEMIAGRIHPEDIPLLQEMIDLARGPGSDLDYEYRLQMPDGSVRHLHLVAHGTLAWDNQLEYVGAIQDVTQQRLADEALSKARSNWPMWPESRPWER